VVDLPGTPARGRRPTGRELIERCRENRPDLIITEIDLPGIGGIAASVELNRDKAHQVPVILVAAGHDADTLERAGVDHIMAYLTKPVKPADLASAMRLAVLRFEHFLIICQEAAELGQALQDRKLLEQVKAALIRGAGLDEAAAFQRLQQLADEKGQKLIGGARTILIADEAFSGSRPSRSRGAR
jgi:response regulator NasT